MRALSPVEKEAVVSMARRPEGAVFLKYLEEISVQNAVILVASDDAHQVRKAQGTAVLLQELLKAWRG